MTTTPPPGVEHAEQHLGPYGRLVMDITTDHQGGSSTYTLTAPHVRGQVTLLPAVYRRDPTRPAHSPSDVLVLFDHAGVKDRAAPHLPLRINGIELVGESAVDYLLLDQGLRVGARRADGAGNPVYLPPRTAAHAGDVLGAVVRHYRERPDRSLLEAAATLAAAPVWLERYRGELAELDQRLRLLTRSRDECAARVEVLLALLAFGIEGPAA